MVFSDYECYRLAPAGGSVGPCQKCLRVSFGSFRRTSTGVLTARLINAITFHVNASV